MTPANMLLQVVMTALTAGSYDQGDITAVAERLGLTSSELVTAMEYVCSSAHQFGEGDGRFIERMFSPETEKVIRDLGIREFQAVVYRAAGGIHMKDDNGHTYSMQSPQFLQMVNDFVDGGLLTALRRELKVTA